MGAVGRSIDALGLYIATTIGISAMIVIVDKQYPSYNPNKYVFLILSALFVVFGKMYYMGWFHDLQLWYTTGGPDPHNWMWALSKILGFAVPVPLIREENWR